MEVAEYLYKNGANLDVEGEDGTTAETLLSAYRGKQWDIADLLEGIEKFHTCHKGNYMSKNL